MITFIIGLVILFVGAALYGKFCEHVFGPDDRKTPAYTKEDGVEPARSSDRSRASSSDPSHLSPSRSAISSAVRCTTTSPA